jgi:hypothetical protein
MLGCVSLDFALFTVRGSFLITSTVGTAFENRKRLVQEVLPVEDTLIPLQHYAAMETLIE